MKTIQLDGNLKKKLQTCQTTFYKYQDEETSLLTFYDFKNYE